MKKLPLLTVVVLTLLVTSLGIVGVLANEPVVKPEEKNDLTTETSILEVQESQNNTTTGPEPERGVMLLKRLLNSFDLNETQKETILTEAQEMHESGADLREIRDMVVSKLESYGVDRSEIRERVQKIRLRYQLHELHREIHELDRQLHKINRIGDHHHPDLSHTLQERFNLTDEQVNEIATQAHEMRQQGATRMEIKEMVKEKLESFGVDLSRDEESDSEK